MRIPRTREAIQDTLVAAAFMVMGVALPGALLDQGFEAHIGGIALGTGLGWLVRSIMLYNKDGVISNDA
jgi:hypothetical protein